MFYPSSCGSIRSFIQARDLRAISAVPLRSTRLVPLTVRHVVSADVRDLYLSVIASLGRYDVSKPESQLFFDLAASPLSDTLELKQSPDDLPRDHQLQVVRPVRSPLCLFDISQ